MVRPPATIDAWATPALLLAALPILGGLLGLAFWSMPRASKVWALALLAATGLMLGTYAGSLSAEPWTVTLMALLVLTAFLTALGQVPRNEAPPVLSVTLILLGLGMAVLTSQGGARAACLAGIFAVVGLAVFYYGASALERRWEALAIYGLGIVCLGLSVVTTGTLTSALLLVATMIAVPLFPLHGALVASLCTLPGSLPAFLVVLLPSLGFSWVAVNVSGLPGWPTQLLIVLAVLGPVYAALKAVVQFRVGHLLAYAAVTQMALLWWAAAMSRAASPPMVVYFSALALVMSGLFLGGHHLHARFGHLDMDKLGGLARSMPRFATVLVLLVTAAAGLPFFAVFSAFLEIMLHDSITFHWSAPVILLTWVMASWYYPVLIQGVLFGRPAAPARGHRDLGLMEALPLIVMVLVLAIAGLVPSDMVGFTPLHVEEVAAWRP